MSIIPPISNHSFYEMVLFNIYSIYLLYYSVLLKQLWMIVTRLLLQPDTYHIMSFNAAQTLDVVYLCNSHFAVPRLDYNREAYLNVNENCRIPPSILHLTKLEMRYLLRCKTPIRSLIH
jgi:hypothetical protein